MMHLFSSFNQVLWSRPFLVIHHMDDLWKNVTTLVTLWKWERGSLRKFCVRCTFPCLSHQLHPSRNFPIIRFSERNFFSSFLAWITLESVGPQLLLCFRMIFWEGQWRCLKLQEAALTFGREASPGNPKHKSFPFTLYIQICKYTV